MPPLCGADRKEGQAEVVSQDTTQAEERERSLFRQWAVDDYRWGPDGVFRQPFGQFRQWRPNDALRAATQ